MAFVELRQKGYPATRTRINRSGIDYARARFEMGRAIRKNTFGTAPEKTA